MRINKPPRDRQIIFYVSMTVTIGLVLGGWFFSLNKTWNNINLSSKNNFSQVADLSEGMQDIGSDFKNDLQEPADEIAPVLNETIQAVGEAAKQRNEASNLMGELMKENLENQYGENQENLQTPTE